MLEVLIGHPTLQDAELNYIYPASPEAKLAFGEALGRLVSAESMLEALHVQHCYLGDDALRPLLAAVAQSTTLRRLDCRWNGISPEFARCVVLPAVRSNTSLQELWIAVETFGYEEVPGLAEAEALVRARQQV